MDSLPKPRIAIQNRSTILLFINQIKQNRCIWDETDVNHRNIKARQDAWLAIARRMGVNVPLLRRKWRSLCSSYLKIRKDWENMQAQSKGTRCPRPSWFAYDEMDFLGNSTRRTRGKTGKYLILDEEQTRASKPGDVMVDIVNPNEDAEETEEIYETTPESNYTEASCEYTLTFDLNEPMAEDTSATLYYEKSNNNDEIEEESELPLEKRYINEKRKTILLHELNEKLEKELQQQAAKVQLQQMKIDSLEKKLEHTERKIAKLMKTSQEDYAETVSGVEQAAKEAVATKENSMHFQQGTFAVHTVPLQDIEKQCDSLCDASGMKNHEDNQETIRQMSSSIKRMESIIGKFAGQSSRRYSGFGEFLVHELNGMDETTSIRLIHEITSMLQKEGQNYRNNHAKRHNGNLS
ncbi:liprin-alpha-like isoform X2 [Anopheles stephensi]|uniref:liprin-alpha-like isoform X2 n=2 Tax=Anopheles stephensi TaxID=30069 RepID=UPI001658ACE6|nr:liprin-alpha-like isoform X2 [Anopheles stephensi]